MNITVLNGSPKGDYSVSLHYVKYIDKISGDEFRYFNVGQKIHSLEKSPERRDDVINSVRDSDLILICTPVYSFLITYQLMRFFEVLNQQERKAFEGKYCSQIFTSMHFFDHTARDYMSGLLYSLGAKPLMSFCAETEDLKTVRGQQLLESFWKQVLGKLERNAPAVMPMLAGGAEETDVYNPDLPCDMQSAPDSQVSEKEFLIIADRTSVNSNLSKMIRKFQNEAAFKTRILYIEDMPGKGGCLGCLNCTIDGECIYNDGFSEFHKDNILHADGIIYAAEIKDGWFHSCWKRYDDRCFYNGHRISQKGMPAGYLISGPLSSYPLITEILKGRSEVGQLMLLDIISDDCNSSGEIDERISEMAKFAGDVLINKYELPSSFLGTGGLRIFRDLIYTMRGFMREDHRFYKLNKMYDFPHKKRKSIIQGYLIGWLMKIPSLKKRMIKEMKNSMIRDYQKLIEEPH